ncbi:MAG TPA: LysM peptidoglycan-binding domain-containing protein [Desulfotomaculum sp.]|nr:LysM peptidoglycan-binding domain-containing protein [Desulfotomaculum sp.]
MRTRTTLFFMLLLQGMALFAGLSSAVAGPVCQPGREAASYTVVSGDALWGISRAHGITVERLMRVNGLHTTLILPGQVLRVPRTGAAFTLSRDEFVLMARIINAEARGESFLGKVAVGAVIMNRLRHPAFPDGIQEIIFQCTNGVHEFTPVADGSINLEPDKEAFRAAQLAAEGVDPTNGALFFYNPRIATDRWIRTLPVTANIGNHVFAAGAVTGV